MKKNNGVTIISLVITIIVIVILASVTIYYGLNHDAEQAAETKIVYDVSELMDAVSSRILMNNLNSEFYYFVGKNDFGTRKVNSIEYSSEDGWYLINSKSEFEELGLDNHVGEYLVNYVTGEVISVKGITYKDVVYYSLSELKKKMGGGTSILANAEYDSNKGVNKPVLTSGMVPVKLSGGKWVVTSTDDEAWYDYSKEQMAWANVMLMDELTVEGYDNTAVKNASLSELVGKEVENEGSAYVWIPRYTANSVGETGSKIIFSNLIDDVTSSNGETYTCPDAFKYHDGSGSLELTGIWVSKYEAGFNE